MSRKVEQTIRKTLDTIIERHGGSYDTIDQRLEKPEGWLACQVRAERLHAMHEPARSRLAHYLGIKVW